MEALTQQIGSMIIATSSPEIPLDSQHRSVADFPHYPHSGATFKPWLKHCEAVFSTDLADGIKIRLLLRKLGPDERTRYSNFILPDEPSSSTFDQTIQNLK